MDFLFHMTDVHLFSLLIVIGVVIAISGVVVVKLLVPHELRLKDNAVIGSVGSLISLIYGVLVGITALFLINNLSYTADAVQREANATANIYRDVTWLKEPTRSQIKSDVTDYIKQVMTVEWAQMESGQDVKSDADALIDKMSNVLRNYPAKAETDSLILRDLLDDIRLLYDAREERIAMSNSELSAELWVVILIGTFLTIGINFLFGMNFYLHLLTTMFAAIMASSMIFLLLTLDRPFQGEFVIEPDAFQAVLNTIKKDVPSPVATVVKKDMQ